MSFRREKYEPFGGPDGGNGGDGGDVILRAAPGVDTLLDFKGKHHWRAENGRPGAGRECTGSNGADLLVDLPIGTMVFDRDTGLLLKDLAMAGETCVIARGGRGGKGNRSFASPTHQSPREFEPGQPGEERHLRLELKLIADVGLVGLPNAGKSTLLSRMTRARPKIAAYPFTTLTPQLGIVVLSDDRRFVVADIPGLIAGAHLGSGLGDAFLRHIERTRIIVHLIDACPLDGSDPLAAYHTIREELREHSAALAAKEEVVVANKLDLTGADEAARRLESELGREVLTISAATGRDVGRLAERLWSVLNQATPQAQPVRDLPAPPHAGKTS